MIFLFSDYGLEGPYIGQVETVLQSLIPQEKVINLMADAPRNNPKASAYLLASLIRQIPESAILFCVVDPGVGTDIDSPVALNINGKWFVGPDNGLFDIVCRRAGSVKAMKITWRPENLSTSFHGRDLYAPVCVKIANNEFDFCEPFDWKDIHDWPDDLYEIIYIDHFGNCITGIRSSRLDRDKVININDRWINYAATFGEASQGREFWYSNSNDLVEIAVNNGSAADLSGLKIGDGIIIHT